MGLQALPPTTVRSGVPFQYHPLHQRDLVGRVMPTQPFGQAWLGRPLTGCCEKGSSPLMFQVNSQGLNQGGHWVGRLVGSEYLPVPSEPCCPCVA